MIQGRDPAADRSDAQPMDNHARTIVVQPSGISFGIDAGETIMAAALRQGLRWPTVCQGNAECAACTFSVGDDAHNLSSIENEEQARLSAYVRPPGADPTRTFRLACRARVISGTVTIIKRGVRPDRRAQP